MRTFGAFGAFLLAATICSAMAPVAAQKGRAPVETGLVGSVVLGPVRALGGLGRSASRPVGGAKVIVAQRENGPVVASTLTDGDGQYELTLAPGTYWVTLETTVSYRLTKDLPKAITVIQGKATTLDVLLDTGIR